MATQRQCTTTTPVVLGSLFDSISPKLGTLSEEKLAIVSSHSWHRCWCGEWRERQPNRQTDRQTDKTERQNRETKGKEQGRGKRRRKERVAQLIDWRKWRYSKMANRLKE